MQIFTKNSNTGQRVALFVPLGQFNNAPPWRTHALVAYKNWLDGYSETSWLGNLQDFDVRLVEYTGDSQELYLGGGSWNNDGSGTIPEGGLTRHYRGPCPPSGQARDFAFVVAAMHKGSMQPLAVRLHRFTQE